MAEVSEVDFVKANPLLPVSARIFNTLSPAEQKECIAGLIDGAVYCDSWEAYFNFALCNNVAVNDEVALEAVQAVGLDPASGSLWVTAANCCSSPEEKRKILQFALSVPLFNRKALVDAYKSFEESINGTVDFEDEHETALEMVASSEAWPDRYVDLTSPSERVEVRKQWVVLLETMFGILNTDVISSELQASRMDLAFRQMCVQLPEEDSCWYDYAVFQLYTLKDEEQATNVVDQGLLACGNASFSLNNLRALLTGQQGSKTGKDTPQNLVIDERLAAGRYAVSTNASEKKEHLKSLRGVGKAAAQDGVHDWKVYSQWHAIENYLTKDQKMASKVLENGMICCSSSPRDAVLLGSEAIQYHLIHRHEREALGYAEQQVEQASQSKLQGRRRAAWNTLVQTESQLGLSFSKAELRRGEEFPQSALHTFLERSRVGCYLPCESDTLKWVQFVDDYTLEKRQEKEAPFKEVQPASSAILFPALSLANVAAPSDREVIDESSWKPFEFPPNPFAALKQSEDPDEVVGSRELRGRWAYRVKVDGQTEARLKREERLRKFRNRNEDTSAVRSETAMGSLVQQMKALPLTENQKQRLRSLSVDWIINQLISSELDLREVLQARSAAQMQ